MTALKQILGGSQLPDRTITLPDFARYMPSVGVMEPEFLLSCVPKLRFASLGESIKASRLTADFLRTNPSLPVSFDIEKALQVLREHMHNHETYSALQRLYPSRFPADTYSSWGSESFSSLITSLAGECRIDCLSIILQRHVTELKSEIDLVKEVVCKIPFNAVREREFQSMVSSLIVPYLPGLSGLASVLLDRARLAGHLNEPEIGLETISVLNSHPGVTKTPLEHIREKVLASERPEVETLCAPVKAILETQAKAKQMFGIHLGFENLESERELELERVASNLLVTTGNLQKFCEFCETFSVDKDKLLVSQITSIKQQLLSGDNSMDSPKRVRLDPLPSLESSIEVLYSLVEEISDADMKSEALYSVLTGIHSLGITDVKFELLAKEIASPNSLLEMYLQVGSVQSVLNKFEDYAFIKERPDFLMRTENVSRVAVELSMAGELEAVEALAEVFTYISVDEMKLLRLSYLYQMKAEVPEIADLLQACLHSVVERFVELVLYQAYTEQESRLLREVNVGSLPEPLRRDIEKLELLLRDFNKSEFRHNLLQYLDIAIFRNMLEGDSVEEKGKLERAKLVFSLNVCRDREVDETDSLLEEICVIDTKTVSRHQLETLLVRAEKVIEKLDSTDLRILRVVEEVVMPLQSMLLVIEGGVHGLAPASLVNLPLTAVSESVRKHMESTPVEFENKLMVLNALTCNKLTDADISKIEGFRDLESVLRCRDFLMDCSFHELVPMIHDSVPSGSCHQPARGSAITNRAKWGSIFEQLSIPFSREVLLQSADDKKAVKQILNDCFPLLVVKSGFDVGLLKQFGSDFGRAEQDILVKVLELSLRANDYEKSECVLIELLETGDVDQKLVSFILPCLDKDESVRWLVSRCTGPLWQRAKQIIAGVDAIPSLNASEGILRELLNGSSDKGKQTILEMLTKELKTPATGTDDEFKGMLRLGKFVLDQQLQERYVVDSVKRIQAFPDVTFETCVQRLVELITELASQELAFKSLKQLLQSVPLSVELLTLARVFKERFNGVSDADMKLLENRLVLKKYDVPENRMKEANFSLKKMVEIIYSNAEICNENLVEELVAINNADGEKLRVELVKRWLTEDGKDIDSSTVVAVLQPVTGAQGIIPMLLKIYFNPKIELGKRIACFDVLFLLYPKQAVLAVYNNAINDLVEIQKNLTYLFLLSQRNKIIKPMEYKDFVTLDKALVVKTLLGTSNWDLIALAADIVIDYAICDFQLGEKLQERVKMVVEPNQVRSFLNGIQESLERAGIASKLMPLNEANENETSN